jgi:DNA polymerase III subunit epsilon
LDFVAIDFETATNFKDSACAVGIVSVKDGEVVDKFYTLIKPPGNEYNWYNTRVHGITAEATENAPTFIEVYSQIKNLMFGNLIVAHNEAFDRNILYHTMESNGLNYSELKIKSAWECTVKIYRKKGNFKVNLAACCERHDIPLDHHNALSDALACAKLYLLHKAPLFC